jgi:hypothetical protein
MLSFIKNDIKDNICINKKRGNRDSGQENDVTRIKNSFAYKLTQ